MDLPPKVKTMQIVRTLSGSQFVALWKSYKHNPTVANELLLERCKYDLDLFTRVFFPHYSKHPFNQFHRDCFRDWVSAQRKTRRADAAPRGSAKSTLKALIKPIHDLCYGLETFIVVISNTQDQSAGKLKDIRRELLENPILRRYFGSFFSSTKVAETEFVATCNGHQTMFSAYSSGSEIRGIRFGASRPSKIICDDVEHSEEVNNEEIRKKYSDWFREVVSQVGDENTNIEVIGTVLHKKSLLIELMENPAYASRKYQSIVSWADREDLWQEWRRIYGNLDNSNRLTDADAFYKANETEMLKGTEVLWPAKESYLDLMKLMYEIGRRAFMKERQNEPIASDEALFDTFHWFREVPEGLLVESSGLIVPWADIRPFSYGAMDPATGQTKPKSGKKGDFTSIVSGYLDSKNRLFVHSDWTKRAAPSHYFNAMFDLNDQYKYVKFGVETNLYRNLMLPNIEAARKERERALKASGRADWAIQMALYDIEAIENKIKRIFTLEPKVTNGYILFNRSLSPEFKSQMESFPLGEHDDGPDALEMLWGMANNRYGISSVNVRPQQGR